MKIKPTTLFLDECSLTGAGDNSLILWQQTLMLTDLLSASELLFMA